MILRLAASLLFLLLARPLSVSALEIPKRPEGYVSDYAGMISPAARAGLEEELHRYEEKTSNQVVVVTFPSLEGEVLEDFSIRLAEAWQIGQKGKDNGVILLVFKNDRKVRIEVGYGLEGALTDATSRLIIENEVAPRFREGKFDEGIEAAVQAIVAVTQGEYEGRRKTSSKEALSLRDIFFTLFFLTIFLANSILLFLLGVAGFAVALGALLIGQLLFAFYAFGFGIVCFVIYFIFGTIFRNPMILSRNGSIVTRGGYGGGGWGGGGFGGGGGSFGGGGASGGW